MQSGWRGVASPKVRGEACRAPSLLLCGSEAGSSCPGRVPIWAEAVPSIQIPGLSTRSL